jgi:general secretion pathway protein D
VTVLAFRRGLLTLFALGSLCACEQPQKPALPALASSAAALAATPRSNGALGSPALPPPAYSIGGRAAPADPGHGPEPAAGAYSLEFSDTDIREVAAQILGGLLHVNYVIDPAVHGTATLHTAQPLSGRQLLPALQMLLGNAGATLVPDEGMFRIIATGAAGASGSVVMPLQFVSADELAKVLQPLIGANAKVVAETSLNALLVSGDASQVQAVRELVRTFDADELTHQSYAVLPVGEGSARDFAEAMRAALHGQSGGTQPGAAPAGLIQVVPLVRFNAVLIIAAQPNYIDAARRVYALIERQRRHTVRSWHVLYLQASNANTIAYTLQMAFTPNNVTAQPEAQQTAAAPTQAGSGIGQGISAQTGASGGGASGGLGAAGAGIGGAIGSAASASPSAATAARTAPAAAAPPAAANPLLGGLDQNSGEENADALRILPNAQNNAVLIYGTREEEDTVLGMLNKIDILPMQVRIDAVIAEVTLNDSLKYGTQFFFKAGGINGILNNATATVTSPAAVALGASFPGFVLSGGGLGGAPIAISALQAVTTVNVLSSPQVTVVDNQQARLQVGSLVPYLTQTSQSTLTSNAPVINSIAYQPTGVILAVTPRVNAGGLITLDVSQEVSDVNTSTTSTSGIASPTFDERNLTTRVVVQDGETVGLAGLIQDSMSRGNQGIPWLKDIPVLGALAGTQANQHTRTELLVLITPHLIRDQTEMHRLTEDLREALAGAAAIPSLAAAERLSGSPDPNRRLRERLRRTLDGGGDP